MLDKLLELVRSLTYREVGIIALLSILAAPGYLLYWSGEHPDTLIDFWSGERIEGYVDNCLLLSFRQQGQRRWRVVTNIREYREEGTTIALSAGSFTRWPDERAIELCRELEAIREAQ